MNVYKSIQTFCLIFPLFTTACSTSEMTESEQKMEIFVSDLMRKMTLEEKIGQSTLISSWWDITGPVSQNNYGHKAKDGHIGGFFNALSCEFLYRLQKEVVENSRMGIPLLFGYDIIHGYKTTFPTPLAMSTSWDTLMIERSTRCMAEEASADGLHWAFAPMVDIARDPRWGRVAEGAGEDTYLGAQIARAQVRGIQGDNLKDSTTLAACVKHFAAYGAPVGGRDYNSVDMSERQLREFYLPPYKAAVDEGCQTIMASFNDINGVPATANRWLLTDLLRNEWGFKGMVVTDYTGIFEMLNHRTVKDSADAGANALSAGADMDMQSGIYMNYSKENFDKGVIKMEDIDRACRNVLNIKYKLGLFENPYKYCDTLRARKILKHPKFFKASHEMAKRSIVLLKNENSVLPVSRKTRTIALIGPMATDRRNQLGTWHTAGRKETVTPISEALLNKYTDSKIIIAEGCEFEGNDRKGFGAAIQAARSADVVIMCMGEQEFESGEAASKTNLHLTSIQTELIHAVSKVGKPMILLLHNGRPMILSDIEDKFEGILDVWHLGSMAGPAIADVVSGDYNPSAKLTMSFPRTEGQIPIYYNYLNTGRPENLNVRFTSRYLDCPNAPLYPFGYGLSYTSFEYSDIVLDKTSMSKDGVIHATVHVKNTGKVDGEEIVQMYISDRVASVSRPIRELKGFKKIMIPTGQSVQVTFNITNDLLEFYNADIQKVSEPGEFDLFIGGSSQTDNQTVFTLRN